MYMSESLVPVVDLPSSHPTIFPSDSRIILTMAEKSTSVKVTSVDAVSIASSTPPSTWRGWLWDSADVSKEERRFLLKVGSIIISPRYHASNVACADLRYYLQLDFTLLTFGTLGMLIKWVIRPTNISLEEEKI
jgi:hypothetical protein